MCKLTNNSNEIRDIVATLCGGLVGNKSADEVADVRDALTHLCYMTENIEHQADVSLPLNSYLCYMTENIELIYAT